MRMAKGGRRSDKKNRPKLGVIRIEKCHKFSKYKLFAEILDLPFLTTWPPYSLNRLICYICAWHHRTPPSPPTMCTVSQCIPICVLWNQYFLCLVYNSKRYSLLNKSFFVLSIRRQDELQHHRYFPRLLPAMTLHLGRHIIHWIILRCD